MRGPLFPSRRSPAPTKPRPMLRPPDPAPPRPPPTSPAAVGQSKMEGPPLALLALRLLLLATLPAAGWLKTGPPDASPPGAPKVGPGGRSLAASPSGTFRGGRGRGTAASAWTYPPSGRLAAGCGPHSRRRKGETHPGMWKGRGGGRERTDGALAGVGEPRDAELRGRPHPDGASPSKMRDPQ